MNVNMIEVHISMFPIIEIKNKGAVHVVWKYALIVMSYAVTGLHLTANAHIIAYHFF